MDGMKCPYCDYEYNGYDNKTNTNPIGDFYKLPLDLERKAFMYLDKRELFGCPKCGKTFIEIF